MAEKKKNVAMIGQKRIPSREGGVEIAAEELAVRMVRMGYAVTCFNRRGHHTAGAEFDDRAGSTYKGVRCVDVPTINRKGLAAASSSFFAALRSAFGQFDIVHFHAEGPAFMAPIPRLFGKRVIVTVHGLDHRRAKWGRFARWYILNGEKHAVKYADEIIVLSRSAQRYFRDTYGRETVFIPNGAQRPSTVPAQEIRERLGLSESSYILYLGRLVPEKGLDYLIPAFREVKTDKKLVIAGGASDTAVYEKQLRKLAAGDERIVFTGFVQGRLLEELYSNAYLYTLPSDLEGLPLSLLEAMSYGNCCLTSDIPECAEVVEDKAVMFRRSDTADLRQKLQTLCDHPETVAQYRVGAADFICGKYNWDDVAEKTLGLYRG